MKILQHRTNNAYDTILVVDADTNTVLSAWMAGKTFLAFYKRDRNDIGAVDG